MKLIRSRVLVTILLLALNILTNSIVAKASVKSFTKDLME